MTDELSLDVDQGLTEVLDDVATSPCVPCRALGVSLVDLQIDAIQVISCCVSAAGRSSARLERTHWHGQPVRQAGHSNHTSRIVRVGSNPYHLLGDT